MSFYFPLGLLGLLGIPVLILIYVIKSKYTEQTIASTYLWELSEKFLKKRKPVSKLTGILTLILQILAVIAASLLIAHPVFTMRNSANDIYFILDGSASMNMQQDGSTRFDRAKDKINGIIDDSLSGSSYTLVFVRDTVNVAFEGVTQKQQAKSDVAALGAGWSATECSSAMSVAQEYFDSNRSAIIYLITDKPYETENITLIDVSSGENNIAFNDYGYTFEGDGVCGTGKVISYCEDAEITVELSASDTLMSPPEKIGETTVKLMADEPAEFKVQTNVSHFTKLQLKIVAKDALDEDNVVILYDEAKAQERKVLLVSDSKDGIYLRNAISSAGKAQVDAVSVDKYSASDAAGYGLCVFNGFTPAELPKNAAIWLIDAVDGTGKGSGIKFRDYQTPKDETGPASYFVPEYTRGTSVQEKDLMRDIVGREIAVRKYAKYGIPRNFTSVMKVDGDTLIAAGLNENNDREVVFAFAIGDSDFGLKDDFLILVRNLMNYSFPSVIEDTVYDCGDIMKVNVVPGCENIVVTSPSGRNTTLDTEGKAYCSVQLNETGTYTVTVKLAGSDESSLCSFACVPETESRSQGGGTLVLSGEREFNYSDGYYDKLLAFFIVICVLLLADWGIYCYEQYQLR